MQGPAGRRSPGAHSSFKTTGLGRLLSVGPWMLVLLSWGPFPVLLQDPRCLVRYDCVGRNPRPPSEVVALQGGSREK